jgi:hypothetical protein
MDVKKIAWASLLLLIILYLGLFWFSRYVPTQDGPSHLENAILLRDLCLPGDSGAEQYYRLNVRTGSNLLAYAAVAAFATLLPPVAAERLFFSLYVVGFAAAVYGFARAAGARTPTPALAALPYALAFPFHMGFFDFCLAVAIVFAAWAYFWRRRDRLRVRDLLILNSAAVITYLAHVGPAVMLVTGLLLLNAWLAFSERSRRPANLKKRLVFAAALLPGYALPIFFITTYPRTVLSRLPWRDLFASLVTGSSFRVFSSSQLYLGVASLGVVAAAVALRAISLWRDKKTLCDAGTGPLLLAVGTLALYFLAPDAGAGGSIISARLLIIPWPLFLVWAGDDFGRAGRWAMLLAASTFALTFWIDTLCHYRTFNRELRDFCSGAGCVEEGSTVAYLYFSGWQYRVAVFAGASSYYALSRDVVNFNNYEADLSKFPVNFDYPGFRPYPWDLWPPEKYRVRKFARAVDYVVTWELPAEAPVAKKLWGFYEVVHAQGRLVLFKVKDKYRAPPREGGDRRRGGSRADGAGPREGAV